MEFYKLYGAHGSTVLLVDGHDVYQLKETAGVKWFGSTEMNDRFVRLHCTLIGKNVHLLHRKRR